MPNKANTIPHFAKIARLKGVTWVINANEKTMTAPPINMSKLRCAVETCMAIRLAVNMVVVKEAAANNPQNKPDAQSIAVLL